MEIKVSVIVPVYNVENYIVDCLRSICEQSLKEIEIIVINDGSIDNSILKIENEVEDDRIIIEGKGRIKNMGVSVIRNQGIDLARGEYIYFVDGDDFLDQMLLEKVYKYAKKFNLDCVIFDVNLYCSQDKIISNKWRDGVLDDNKVYDSSFYLKQYFMGKGFPSIWNKLFKREIYLKNKIKFPENLRYGEDGVTLIKLIINSKNIGKINENLYYYRQRNNSVMQKKIPVEEYETSYNLALKYLNQKEKFEEYKIYLNTYKFKYVYRHLLKYNYYSLKNNKYRSLYQDFFYDLRAHKLLNLNRQEKILVILYRMNIHFGNIFVILKESFRNIRKKIKERKF